MSHIPMPMNAAHQHAANAEDNLGNGLLIPAAEEHLKAAEAYQAAVERSNDESVQSLVAKRTLRLLYNEHCKAAKEINRKIEKLKEEGKDPSLPQKLELPQFSAPRSSAHLGITRSTPSTPPLRPMTDSQNTVDESFMLLAGQRSDPGDAFNQFWNIMQGMLDNLSQPVAFATVPLGNTEAASGVRTPPTPRRDASLSSDTDSADEPMFSRFTRRIGIGRDGNKAGRKSTLSVAMSSYDDEFDEGLFDEESLGDELSESFFVIPSGNEPTPAALKRENVTLKLEADAMKKRLEATERVLQLRKEQDLQLRDSIFQATREAQRAMGASMVGQRTGLDLSSLNLNVPAVPLPGITSGREAQYARRLKELEEELRGVRAENEKHKAMIAKFRERWEKLKDSAKRKKEAKAAAAAVSMSTREKIVEEPEAEEELDGTGA
ncbi:hypothetical protein D9615_001828 [Tricholomella constricta]|uniref:MIT domain-containing protein n=1 Tax=Tricholomella constricta TaxID=117010 RepID=A0A8H5HNX2_9AGAR|nr:hypothetical protein D9615_001828 [Tricholomella constricta]